MKSDIKDLSGQQQYNWTVLAEAGRASNNEVMWRCRCKCGTIREVRGAKIRQGNSKSCGCTVGEDIAGNKYGEWTVVGKTRDHEGKLRWLCKSGNIYAMFTMSRLKNRAVTSGEESTPDSWEKICSSGDILSSAKGEWIVGEGMPKSMTIAVCKKTHVVVGFEEGSQPPCLVQKNSSADDLSGKVYKTWRVLEKAGPNKHGQMVWTCQCEVCGIRNDIVSFAIKRGNGCKNCKKLGMDKPHEEQETTQA